MQLHSHEICCAGFLQEKIEAEPAAPRGALADALDHTILLAHHAGAAGMLWYLLFLWLTQYPPLQEKVEAEPAVPTGALADALDHTILLAHQAGQLQRDCGLDILPEEFTRSTLKFGLIEVRSHAAVFRARHSLEISESSGVRKQRWGSCQAPWTCPVFSAEIEAAAHHLVDSCRAVKRC